MQLTDSEIINALEPLVSDSKDFQTMLSPEREKFAKRSTGLTLEGIYGPDS